MGKYVFIISLTALLSACDTQVQDFVNVQPSVGTPAGPTLNANAELKISPGNITATTATHRIEATITATNHQMTSSSLGMTVGIQKVSKQ